MKDIQGQQPGPVEEAHRMIERLPAPVAATIRAGLEEMAVRLGEGGKNIQDGPKKQKVRPDCHNRRATLP